MSMVVYLTEILEKISYYNRTFVNLYEVYLQTVALLRLVQTITYLSNFILLRVLREYCHKT